MGKAKKFKPSEPVEIQRRVGAPWELATYRGPCWGPGAEPTAGGPMKGWHRIQLDRGAPRYIDMRSGMECDAPNEHTRESWYVLVPSSRLRMAHDWQITDGLPACTRCGNVQRADGRNRACAGKLPRVTTRTEVTQ